jgi:histidine ammonia-lyase
VIYRYGSVGASGDLIPLSGIARALMGEGQVRLHGELKPAVEALAAIGMKPEPLTMKEGLAIVNGTSFMSAVAGLAAARLCSLLPLSIAVAASLIESMLAMDSPYMAFVHEQKRHAGQVRVASFIRDCLRGSKLVRVMAELRMEWRSMLLEHGRAQQENVQDYYSLRGIAHGFGPFADDLERGVTWIENEMNSLNDNPLIDTETEYIYSSANFLGDYVAVAGDQLRADIAKAGTWIHALLGNMINPRKNRALPSCLVCNPDAVTGFKTIQLLVAALAIHNRNRCLPVSSVMLPTEGDNQDMVSLGTHSAMDLLEVTENFETIVAATLLAAAQALEIRGIQKGSPTSQKLWEFTRQHSRFVDLDRPLHDEIASLKSALTERPPIAAWYRGHSASGY